MPRCRWREGPALLRQDTFVDRWRPPQNEHIDNHDHRRFAWPFQNLRSWKMSRKSFLLNLAPGLTPRLPGADPLALSLQTARAPANNGKRLAPNHSLDERRDKVARIYARRNQRKKASRCWKAESKAAPVT